MKLYKQITCIALFCSAAFSLGAQSTHMELSLEDALSAARQNEIQIKNARLDYQAIDPFYDYDRVQNPF